MAAGQDGIQLGKLFLQPVATGIGRSRHIICAALAQVFQGAAQGSKQVRRPGMFRRAAASGGSLRHLKQIIRLHGLRGVVSCGRGKQRGPEAGQQVQIPEHGHGFQQQYRRPGRFGCLPFLWIVQQGFPLVKAVFQLSGSGLGCRRLPGSQVFFQAEERPQERTGLGEGKAQNLRQPPGHILPAKRLIRRKAADEAGPALLCGILPGDRLKAYLERLAHGGLVFRPLGSDPHDHVLDGGQLILRADADERGAGIDIFVILEVDGVDDAFRAAVIQGHLALHA